MDYRTLKAIAQENVEGLDTCYDLGKVLIFSISNSDLKGGSDIGIHKETGQLLSTAMCYEDYAPKGKPIKLDFNTGLPETSHAPQS